MFIKYCNVKFISMSYDEVKRRYPDFNTRLATNQIKIDPEKYIYIRNESVHAEEFYGPNCNGDAFPLKELEGRYHTFLNSRVSVDHQDHLIVGEVLDSVYIKPIFTRIGGSTEDKFSGGGLIENLLGIEIEKLAKINKDYPELILSGKITDTSMGAMVRYTECSIPTCKNIAYTEEQYCEHIKGGKNREIKLANDNKPYRVYEICHDVTWFEDSIIVPLEYGGMAGGQGCDPSAKIMNIITESIELKQEVKNRLIRIVNSLPMERRKDMEEFLSFVIRGFRILCNEKVNE